jgi:subtilisin family serine protease
VPTTHCNNKLIGARYFNAGFGSSGQTLHWTDFAGSPRDSVAGANGHGGHGTHTSSTAGGNAKNPVVLNGVPMGDASGIAPRARLAMYKVCWTYVNPAATDGTGSQNSCYTSDSVSAIDAAVQDGVNVINFSISGSQTSVNDAVEQAFLRAAKAGVFVAASAGNSGPTSTIPSAVAHISPWLTTVAASSHDRYTVASATLGSGAAFSGPSYQQVGTPQLPLIRSIDAGVVAYADLSQAAKTALERCFLPVDAGSNYTALDPAKVAGKMVICYRGGNVLFNKEKLVKDAGGAAMIIQNVPAMSGIGATGASSNTTVFQPYSIPTIHLTNATYSAIDSYVLSSGSAAVASISPAVQEAGVLAPIMAGFSSRGPNLGDSNILKPDLTAPGVDVVAGVTADLSQAQHDAVANGTLVPPTDFASYQGTSMSSPHVAGLAALIKQAHPTWSPAAIKSALMTSGYTTLNDGQPGLANGLLPWAQGAGHVAPNRATDPGLVYDSGITDWTRYQCKVNAAAVTAPAPDNCATLGAIETYNLNLPSITVGAIVGSTTVTRTVTNVGNVAATYTSSFVNPTGFTTVVAPTSLTLAPGESGTFTVKLTNVSAVANVWSYGSQTWSDGVHTVKVPVTARASGKLITAPDLLTGTSTSGTRLVTVKTAFAGRMTANKGGLKDVTMGGVASLLPDLNADILAICRAGTSTANVKVYNVAVPTGTVVARFALRDADVGSMGDDNDLIVVAPNNSFLYSGNTGSNEAVQYASPAAGNYKVCVLAYDGAATMTHNLSSWVVTPADLGGKFNVMLPGTVYAGGTATVGFSWSGLPMGGRFMGGAQFKDVGGVVQATTVVRVETNGGMPFSDAPRDVTSKQLNMAE